MKKSHFKLFICFFAIIVSILFGSSVRAADEGYKAITNGTAGFGGYDPCSNEKSLVCIYGLVAFRISYYEDTSYIGAVDFYDTGIYKSFSDEKLKPTYNIEKSQSKSLNHNKKGQPVTKFQKIDLGIDFDSSKFHVESAQKKVYSKFLNNLGSKKAAKTDGLARNILHYIYLKSKNQNYVINSDFISDKLKNTSGKFVVEPLFLVRIQKQPDAIAGKGKWTYYIGTATTVAQEVTNFHYFYQCKDSGISSSTCQLGWQTRSNKNHVGRIANSMTLSKNWNGISKVSKLKKKDSGSGYSMKTVANFNKGYGMAIVYFDYNETVTHGAIQQYCYQLETDDCDSTNGDYDMSVKVSGTKTVDDASNHTCLNNQNNDSYSVSEFGKLKEDVGIENNEYCALYCNEDVQFQVPEFGRRKGTLKQNLSSFNYTDEYQIRKTAIYNCQVDFKYYYTTNQQEINNISDVYERGIRPTQAQADLANAITNLQAVRDTSDPSTSLGQVCGMVINGKYDLKDCYNKALEQYKASKQIVDDSTIDENAKAIHKEYVANLKPYIDAYDAWTSTWENIRDNYKKCITGNITKDSFKSSDSDIVVTDTDGNSITLSAQDDGSEKPTGGEGSIISISESCKTSHPDSFLDQIICSYNLSCDRNQDFYPKYRSICVTDKLEELLESRQPMTVTERLKWTGNTNTIVDFNRENPIIGPTNTPGYNTSTSKGQETLASGTLNYCKWDLSKVNKLFTINSQNELSFENKITFTFKGAMAKCLGNTAIIENPKSASVKDCACPPNTKHTKINAYHWLNQLELLSGTERQKYMNGLTCTEAISTFCDSNVEPNIDYYEEIVNGEGCSLQDCLQEGNPYEFCSRVACNQYKCTIDIAGKQTTTYIQSAVYREAYLRAKKHGINWNALTKEEANNQLDEIAKEQCQLSQCDNKGDKEPFVYRTVQLHNGNNKTLSFPGLSGTGRDFGSNWSEDLVTKVLNRNNIDESKPMYKITLTPATIRQIRNYNKNQNDYNNPSLDCAENKAACISSFLPTIPIEGKCAGANKNNFYSCVNY